MNANTHPCVRFMWATAAAGLVAWRPAPAAEVAVGDTRECVIEVLGEAKGYVRGARTETLVYGRGYIALRDGVVTNVDLMTDAELAAREERLEQARRARRAYLARERERRRVRREEGERLRAVKRNDPLFAALPPGDQVVFWDAFRRDYPDVPVDAEYVAALAQREEELERERRDRRIAALEQRVAAAERRARDAEDRIERTRYSHVARTYYLPATPVWTAPTRTCPPAHRPVTRRPVCRPTYGSITLPRSHCAPTYGSATLPRSHRVDSHATVSARVTGIGRASLIMRF